MSMRESLEWARQSRAQWQTAYQQAVEDQHSEDADFAVKHVAIFDQMIERIERFLASRGDSCKSN
jgi:hypothetical protein